MNPEKFYMYDDDTIKWENNRSQYCLHVRRDDCSESPREWSNLCTMACWHRNYSLGDDIGKVSEEEFWQRLLRKHVSDEDIANAAIEGKLDGIRIAKSEEEPDCYDIFETCYLAGWQSPKDAKEYLEYSEVSPRAIADYIIDDLTVGHCQTLLEPFIEWMPLWLYDHSGITISCSSRNPYYDPWDSGCVGWIIAEKDTIMRETNRLVLGEDGQPIRIENKHENGSVTYSYKYEPVTDETWRDEAVRHMKNETEIYDQYLRGDVYGYQLYVNESTPDDPEWVDEDSCWGFYGDDIVENGIMDQLCDYGLKEAITENRYESGKAELVKTSYYEF